MKNGKRSLIIWLMLSPLLLVILFPFAGGPLPGLRKIAANPRRPELARSYAR